MPNCGVTRRKRSLVSRKRGRNRLDPEDFSPAHTTWDRGHGRVEIQTIRTSTAFNDYLDWPFLGQVFRIDRPVTDGDGTHPRDEVALGLMDLTPVQADPARLSA
jgi:hypothetical protein